MVKNQVDAFWQLFQTNPGPIYASMIFFGIIESKGNMFVMFTVNKGYLHPR